MGVSIWEGSKAQALIDAITNTQKVDKQQGSGNAGKVLTVGSDGTITPQDPVVSADIKNTLLTCFRHVAWIDGNGQDFYDALESALSGLPVPDYNNTLRYLASSGVILSQTNGFEVVGGSTGDMTETISNNVLNITLPGTSTYIMIRIADYVPAEVSKARLICRYKLNMIDTAAEDAGISLTIKAGSGCAGIYTHRTSNNYYFSIRNSSNTAVDTSKQLALNTWYNVEALIEDNVQTIKVDGETIYTGAANTYFGSSGIVITKTQNRLGLLGLDADIDSLTFQWT